MREAIDRIPGLIQDIYAIVEKLEDLFPGRRFTPDGHLVGSIGEVLAAHRYGLELLPASAEGHDATTADGRLVQIKATQSKSIALRSEPDLLVVLRIKQDGRATEIYNGPGKPVWDACGKMQKNGQRAISVNKLSKVMDQQEGNGVERLPSLFERETALQGTGRKSQ